jgi:hypothetical protein
MQYSIMQRSLWFLGRHREHSQRTSSFVLRSRFSDRVSHGFARPNHIAFLNRGLPPFRETQSHRILKQRTNWSSHLFHISLSQSSHLSILISFHTTERERLARLRGAPNAHTTRSVMLRGTEKHFNCKTLVERKAHSCFKNICVGNMSEKQCIHVLILVNRFVPHPHP